MVLAKVIFKLLLNSKEDYQYTSTEFAWLLDMVNYTLQVSKTIVEADLLCQHFNIHSERRRLSGLWQLWLSTKHFPSVRRGLSTFLGVLGSWCPAPCGRCSWADWQHYQHLYSLQVVFRCFICRQIMTLAQWFIWRHMSSNTWENWQTFGSKSEDNCLAECKMSERRIEN